MLVKAISGTAQPREIVGASVPFAAGAGAAVVIEKRARREVRRKVFDACILQNKCENCQVYVGRLSAKVRLFQESIAGVLSTLQCGKLFGFISPKKPSAASSMMGWKHPIGEPNPTKCV